MDKPTVVALGIYFAIGVPTLLFEDRINALGQTSPAAAPHANRPPPPDRAIWADCDTRQWTPGDIISREVSTGPGRDRDEGRPMGTVVEVQTRERGYSLDQCAGMVCFGASKKAPDDGYAIVRAVANSSKGKVDLCFYDTRTGLVEDRMRALWNDYSIQ